MSRRTKQREMRKHNPVARTLSDPRFRPQTVPAKRQAETRRRPSSRAILANAD